MCKKYLAGIKKTMWDIIGHKKNINALQKTIKNGKVGHAYLIIGSEGVGKLAFAEGFIKTIDKANQYSIIEKLKDKKTISIDQIRDIRKSLNQTTGVSPYKICLIKNANLLSEQASNALLKTLEEPKGKTIIILLADTDSLPATINSRCQIIKLLPVPKSEIYNYVEEKTSDRDLAKIVSSISKNKPETAKYFVDKPKQLEKFKQEIENILNYLKSEGSEKIKKREQIVKKAEKNNLLAWESILHDIMLIQNSKKEYIINSYVADDIERLSEKPEFKNSYLLIKKLTKLNKQVKQNLNYKLLLENFLINI